MGGRKERERRLPPSAPRAGIPPTRSRGPCPGWGISPLWIQPAAKLSACPGDARVDTQTRDTGTATGRALPSSAPTRGTHITHQPRPLLLCCGRGGRSQVRAHALQKRTHVRGSPEHRRGPSVPLAPLPAPQAQTRLRGPWLTSWSSLNFAGECTGTPAHTPGLGGILFAPSPPDTQAVTHAPAARSPSFASYRSPPVATFGDTCGWGLKTPPPTPVTALGPHPPQQMTPKPLMHTQVSPIADTWSLQHTGTQDRVR